MEYIPQDNVRLLYVDGSCDLFWGLHLVTRIFGPYVHRMKPGKSLSPGSFQVEELRRPDEAASSAQELRGNMKGGARTATAELLTIKC